MYTHTALRLRIIGQEYLAPGTKEKFSELPANRRNVSVWRQPRREELSRHSTVRGNCLVSKGDGEERLDTLTYLIEDSHSSPSAPAASSAVLGEQDPQRYGESKALRN